MNGFYSDFIWAEAYRNANGGLGLSYLSPSDIAQSTQWNLNGGSTTTMPGISGTVTVAQLPGFILSQDITISTTISNATLANGTLDGNGTFTGHHELHLRSRLRWAPCNRASSCSSAPITATPSRLSGPNTYTGGTTILAGTLIVANDAALGAAAPANYSIDLNNITGSVEAANGIIFNSLAEGAGTLKLGTTSGAGTSTFTTNRPIAVNGETATINLNGYIATLTGTIASVGANGIGIGSQTGVSDLTIADTSSGSKGVLVLAPGSGSNANFYGNWIISSGTLRVSSDAALGNTTGPAYEIGQIDLDGGTFQAGASFCLGAQPVPDRGQHIRHQRLQHLVFRHADRHPAHADGHQQQHQHSGRGHVRVVECRSHGDPGTDRRDQRRDGDVHERHHANRQCHAVHRPIQHDIAGHHRIRQIWRDADHNERNRFGVARHR